MKILFIGAGNMGQAIISGVLNSKLINSSSISFYETNTSIIESISSKLKISFVDIVNESIKGFDIIFVAVKPQVFNTFIDDIKMKSLAQQVTQNQTVVSIMAGVTIKTIQDFFVNSPSVIRCMPNTPLMCGQGMSVLAPAPDVAEEKIELVKSMFASVGEVEVLEERYIDAVTGLSGSGPAFVFTFIEALIQGGILSGLAYPIAKKLATQTVLGAATMIGDDTTIEELRHKVTSPAGTTIAGVAELENNSFRSAVIKAVTSAVDRSIELSKK